MDWRADTNNGAVFGEFVCSGYLWGQNVGWIHLGSGGPANGIQYQNSSATDYGVNQDGIGNLRGLAWGANIGWVNFEATGAPRVSLLDGKFSGFAWSQNCGWISLSNAQAFVQTDNCRGGIDSDGDGIADAWELQRAGNLDTLTATGDRDGDGASDVKEYLADTNPLDGADKLQVTLFSASAQGTAASVTWSSRPTRLYRIVFNDSLNSAPAGWSDIGLSLLPPSPGATTTQSFGNPNVSQRYFQIEALRPLSKSNP
jgi:hypothetical protein